MADEAKLKNLNKAAILAEIQKRAKKVEVEKTKKVFDINEYCFDEQLKFIRDPSKFKTAVCSRRCLAEGTLVQTIDGPKKIEDIKVGDFVYSEFGQPIKVLKTFFNGKKKIQNIMHNTRTIVKATENHQFLMYNTYSETETVKKISEANSRDKIARITIKRENGKHIPYAYAIGALLGDGCSTEPGKNRIYISSKDELIPNKVGELLEASAVVKNKGDNFTYAIHLNLENRPKEYENWCNNRYAHEKIADTNTILSWDRVSRLAFFAGLLDTDGSVGVYKNSIQIRIGMQAKSVIESLQMLVLDLWNIDSSVYTDDRKKYKNGPLYILAIKNNNICKKILKDLDTHLLSFNKKWKGSYESLLENNFNEKYMGFEKRESGYAKTYDIHVNSPTNLYVLANGLITHNSGKTEACAANLIDVAQNTKNATCLYITLSRVSAERIIWRTLLKIIEEYEIPVKINNKELSIKFLDTNSMIYISGAKDATEIEKFRGMSLNLVYIDELQSFKPYVEDLVEDILSWAVKDVAGTMCFTGTPGPVPAGYFYNISTKPNKKISQHKWTMLQNPWIKIKSGMEPADILREERERKGITENDPTYRREALGEWVKDDNALVIKFSQNKNVVNSFPTDLTYIFGVDIGFNDADAIAVIGYNYTSNNVYLVEEVVQAKQDITTLVKKIKDLQAFYKPVKIVMDAGALGKKIQEEIRNRHGINAEAADKNRKLEYIELLNDDLRTGRFKTFPGSIFEQESNIIVWDYDGPVKKISDRTHSDLLDSVLYSFREAKHYFEKEKEKKSEKYSKEWLDEQEMLLAQQLKAKQQKDEDVVSQEDMEFIFEDDNLFDGISDTGDDWY